MMNLAIPLLSHIDCALGIMEPDHRCLGITFVAAAPYCKQDQQQDYTNTQESGSRRHQAAPPERIGTLGAMFGPSLILS